MTWSTGIPLAIQIEEHPDLPSLNRMWTTMNNETILLGWASPVTKQLLEGGRMDLFCLVITEFPDRTRSVEIFIRS